MATDRSLALARRIALLAPIALLAGAYVAQFGFGLPPCEMCWWQRYPHFAAVALGVVAFVVPRPAMVRPLVMMAALLILASGLIGGFHAGVEYRWWDGPTACATPITGGGDVLDAIMNAPLVRCDVAPFTLFGISLAGYNFLLSVSAAILIMMLARRGRKGGWA